MRGPKPTPIVLTVRQHAVLEQITRRQTNPQHLVRRARIILTAATTVNNDQVARELDVDRGTVRSWRGRWLDATDQLRASEATDPTDQALTACIQSVLADAPRPGAPDIFTAEQVVQIVALACSRPQDAQRPTNYWLAREVADEAVSRGMVLTISPRTVARFLKSSPVAAAAQPLLAEHARTGSGGVCGAVRHDL
jgi:putative transposase